MNEILTLFATVFVTLFVIMDPPGTVPVFLGLTSSMDHKRRNRAARQAILVSFLVIVIFAVFGKYLLTYMGISLPALRAAGGLLLLWVAMELLTGKADEPEASSNTNVAMVPLGTPLLAGPGTIVAIMVFVEEHADVRSWAVIGAAVVAVHVCVWLSMRFANIIQRVLRDDGVTLVTRIAGVLLAAIAVQMVATAIAQFIEHPDLLLGH
ncbi:MarC family protein [Myceligenerans crystallogenes]|uniref:UPF0056 membrane protein n=1 Tax=Myceligenerans crystallogenes TaxID=316335 RepID=A0ABN2N437_9MICO